ncbi:MAG TPA: DUF5947 family protein [Euzebyales bacterium]|nr:DUF5947 family protein [Euzebyales bacterium]
MTRRGLARFTRPSPGPDAGASDGAAGMAGASTSTNELDLPPTLARFVGARTRPTPGEACEMCAVAISDDHRHVVDLERRSLLCVCRGCALLFERTAGGTPVPDRRLADTRLHPRRYRTVPDRYVEITPFTLPGPAWAALQIPVGVAFVVANTQLDRTVAFYPSPGGATESELPLDAWGDIVAANPALAEVEPDVEAVLLRTGGDEPTCHVVPVDRCYELVGAMRLHWRGFDGGTEVREQIAAFFDAISARARSPSEVES